MCGFIGFIGKKSSSESQDILKIISQPITHRGPDSFGTWSDENFGFHVAFRRLAILDLTSAGEQPMKSESKRYVITFNGEIYNFKFLKIELEKKYGHIQWRGNADSEVLLFLIEKYGLEKALEQCVGMFSIALWDRKLNELSLARDRFGEKPLYYGWIDNNFVFGSDLESFKTFPNFNNQLCKKAIKLFLNYSYVPAPLSIFKDILKVEPGTILTFNGNPDSVLNTSKKRYWDKNKEIANAKKNKFKNIDEALPELRFALNESIKQQMISDVPLGAFLSGGIDSSLIVSMMQENSMSKVKTFTVGFENKDYDESPYAKKVANHLGTDHTEVILKPEQALGVIPNLPSIYSEPFADSSQIPTYLVSKVAKSHVTVSLSGDGGDELFAGYNRYFWGEKIWNKASWAPFWVRRSAGNFLYNTPNSIYNIMEDILNSLTKKQGITFIGDKAKRLASRLQFIDSELDLYSSLCTQWNDVNFLLTDNFQTSDKPFIDIELQPHLTGIENMMSWDIDTYLMEDILTKVDRAAMANSLETRAPFLDHRVARTAWMMDESYLVSNFNGKIPLRSILSDYLPRELFERPKTGFGIPVGDWLRGPLYDWAQDLLSEKQILEEGIFNIKNVQDLWNQHQSAKFDHTVKLWNILMFRAWNSTRV
jgi:asparagine synthase (glutamine-hydrolysing)